MFGFHKPKMYRSADGCCICRAKSSSSRFTHSQRYQRDFKSCFGLEEARYGEICNACVLLVKRWNKLPTGSKKNWNHVVDTKGGSSLKTPRKTRTTSRPQKPLRARQSDTHSSSSTSPAQSPSYSNQSDEGSDTEPTSSGPAHSPPFTFLDLTYWKRQRVCCGIVYAGRYGEVLIDPHLYKPCCPKPPSPEEEEELMEEEKDEEEEEEEKEDEDEGHAERSRSSEPPQVKQEVSVTPEVSLEDLPRQEAEECC